MRNSDSLTKRSVETFDAIVCAIPAICYRHGWQLLRSNSITCKFSVPDYNCPDAARIASSRGGMWTWLREIPRIICDAYRTFAGGRP